MVTAGGAVFRRARIGALLLVLAVVAMWAWSVQRQRGERRAWDRTLEVGLAILARDERGERAAAALRSGVPALERRLAREMERYRGAGPPPFVFRAAIVPGWKGQMPLRPASDGIAERALHAWRLWRFRREVDAAAGLDPEALDASLYLLLERPAAGAGSTFAEGSGAAGGEVGMVRAWVDGADATQALAALAHELLHNLGATDKYDAAGHALEPDGLVEPELVPLHPQRLAEWMVGEVPLGPARGRLPASLDELAVGPATAREIGWTAGR